MLRKHLLRLFDWRVTPLLAAAAVALFVLEKKRPLRRRVQPLAVQLWQNGGVAAFGLGALRLALLPALLQAAVLAQRHRFGLLRWLPLPPPLRALLAFLLLDYSSYAWHVLNHRVPLLWRFHNVHHTDLDLDLSTAWRFHAGEVLASVLFRGGAVALVGTAPELVLTYEAVFEACNIFHHSNWRLPYRLERWLSLLLVTPRMHGIHHSIVRQETGSNFSVICSAWDRLHQTLRLNVPQQQIVIGHPAYRNAAEQTVTHLLLMPFQEQRAWQLPSGIEPLREEQSEGMRLAE